MLHHLVYHGIFTEVGIRFESKVNCLDIMVRYDRVVGGPRLDGKLVSPSYGCQGLYRDSILTGVVVLGQA